MCILFLQVYILEEWTSNHVKVWAALGIARTLLLFLPFRGACPSMGTRPEERPRTGASWDPDLH